MTRVLVTGGAGFIGSHLCDHLIAKGQTVLALDNFKTGHQANIEHLLSHPNFTLMQEDVRRLPVDMPVDQIYNLACPASPIQYERHPIDTLETSVLGAMRVLEAAANSGATVLQASTSEVYGDPLEHPQKESYRGNVDILGPRSCYDEGKRCAETLFMQHHLHNGTRIKIVRIFNTYGPRMQPDDGRVISTLVVQALSNLPLTLNGDGTQTRSFMYVSDVVSGLYAMMNGPQEFVGPVNLGNPDERTINQVATQIMSECHSDSELVYGDLPTNDPLRRCPDIALASAMLGWQPQVAFEPGLKLTIEHFRSPAIAASLAHIDSAKSF